MPYYYFSVHHSVFFHILLFVHAERALALKRLSRKRALDRRRAKQARTGGSRGHRAMLMSSGDEEEDADFNGADDDDKDDQGVDGNEDEDDDDDDDDENARDANLDGDCGDITGDGADASMSPSRQAPIDCRRFVSIVCAPSAYEREERVALVTEVVCPVVLHSPFFNWLCMRTRTHLLTRCIRCWSLLLNVCADSAIV